MNNKVYPATKGFPSSRIYCYNNDNEIHCLAVAEEKEAEYRSVNARLKQKDPTIGTEYIKIDVRAVKDPAGHYYVEDHSVWKSTLTGKVNRP